MAELLARAEAAAAREDFAQARLLFEEVLAARGEAEDSVRWRCRLGLARIEDAWENRPGVAAMLRAARVGPGDAPLAADESLAELHRLAEFAASGEGRHDDALAHALAALRIRLALLSGKAPAASVEPGEVAAAVTGVPDPAVAERLASGALRVVSLLLLYGKVPPALAWASAVMPALHRPDVEAAPTLCRELRGMFGRPPRPPDEAAPTPWLAGLLAGMPSYPQDREIAARLADPGQLLFEVDAGFRTALGPLDPDLAQLAEAAVPAFEARGLLLSAAHARALRARARLARLLYPDPKAFRLPPQALPPPQRPPAERVREAAREMEEALGTLHRCVPRLDWRLWSTLTALGWSCLALGELDAAERWARLALVAAAEHVGSVARPAAALGAVAEARGDAGTAAFWGKVVVAVEAEAAVTHALVAPAFEQAFAAQAASNRAAVAGLLAAQSRLGEARQVLPAEFAPRGASELTTPHWTAEEAAAWSALRDALAAWRDAPEGRQDAARDELLGLLASLAGGADGPAPPDPEEAAAFLREVDGAMRAASAALPANVALVRHLLIPGNLVGDAKDGVAETLVVLAAVKGEVQGWIKGLPPVLTPSAGIVLDELSTHPLHPTARQGVAVEAGRAAELVHFVMADLVRELIGGTGATVLLTAADGPLRFLPPGALGSDRPMIEEFAVAGIGSAGLSPPHQPRGRPPRMAALGIADHALHRQRALRAVAGEIGGLLSAFPGSPPPRLDDEADRAGLDALLAEEAELLHIATHLDPNYADPGESRLLLGRGEVLRLAELARRDLSRYALIVLSSCCGGVPAGPELRSPAELLLDAGAGAVLAASWPAEDAPTATLMARFYAALTSAEAPSKAEALRRAQLAVRAERPHPYYWAGFRLWGDWRPLRA